MNRVATICPPANAAPKPSAAVPGAGWEAQLPFALDTAVLALGAESKAAYCLAEGRKARLSRSFGTLTTPTVYRVMHTEVTEALRSARSKLGCVVRDMHPLYLSGELARGLGTHVEVVQHHHAHVASCMAEHGLTSPVIGICCDGAGYGPDRTSWGGEVLYVTPREYQRVAHLQPFGLPGGDAAAIECWRPAWALVRQAYGPYIPDHVRALFAAVTDEHLHFADALLERGRHCPRTSSLGRLFDAVAFLLGICHSNLQEAQAARALQACAETCLSGRLLPVDVRASAGCKALDFAPAIRELLRRRAAGHDVAELAADLHETVAALFAARAVEAAGAFGTGAVVLTGGCMANRWLVARMRHRLSALKLNVFEHEQTSCGDAALPLGQAYVAAARLTLT